jgi:hypothetical protein
LRQIAERVAERPSPRERSVGCVEGGLSGADMDVQEFEMSDKRLSNGKRRFQN